MYKHADFGSGGRLKSFEIKKDFQFMCEFLSYHCMLRKLGYHNRFPYFFLFLSSVFSTAQAIEICYIFGLIKYMLKHAKMMNPFQFYMCFP